MTARREKRTEPASRSAASAVTIGAALREDPNARFQTIRRKLLRWYDRNRRDLPWRHRQHDPYAQWVAEIMLQQTRVETVLAYYERFLARFPTVLALAKATHEAVLKQWEGLGYYRRALHLHNAAKIVAKRENGLPRSSDQWRGLPGIGTYTAAAICSIAFREPSAAVDANVTRVVARLFDLAPGQSNRPSAAAVAEFAQRLLSRQRPGDFNQAWMDLGSAICTPQKPACPKCPLRAQCATFERAGAPQRPSGRTPARRQVRSIVHVVGVFESGERWLVRRRPRGGLWSGLWEFPSVEVESVSNPDGAQLAPRARGGFSPSSVGPNEGRALTQLAHEVGLQTLGQAVFVAKVTRELTHRAIEFRVFRCSPRSGGAPIEVRSDVRWVNRSQFDRLSVSSAHREIQRALAGSRASTAARSGPDAV